METKTKRVDIRRQMIPACAIVVGLTVAVAASDRQGRAPQPIEHQTQSQGAEVPYQYLLQTKQEQLEVFSFRAGKGGWEKIAHYRVTLADMPEIDREYLAAGLVLRNAEELQRALEDYLPSS